MKVRTALGFLLLAAHGCTSVDLRDETREQLNESRMEELRSELDKPAAPIEAPSYSPAQSATRPRIFGCDESKPPVPPQALVKVAPIFPAEAAAQGIEGFATVEFTVTKFGRTKDIVVLESSPQGIFDLAAINAARHFKYTGEDKDGRCIKPTRIQNQIKFELSD